MTTSTNLEVKGTVDPENKEKNTRLPYAVVRIY